MKGSRWTSRLVAMTRIALFLFPRRVWIMGVCELKVLGGFISKHRKERRCFSSAILHFAFVRTEEANMDLKAISVDRSAEPSHMRQVCASSCKVRGTYRCEIVRGWMHGQVSHHAGRRFDSKGRNNAKKRRESRVQG